MAASETLPCSFSLTRDQPAARFFAGTASSAPACLLRLCAVAGAGAAESLPRATCCAGAALAATVSATARLISASLPAESRTRDSTSIAAEYLSALLKGSRMTASSASSSAAPGGGEGLARTAFGARRAAAGGGASAVAGRAEDPLCEVGAKRPEASGSAGCGARRAATGADVSAVAGRAEDPLYEVGAKRPEASGSAGCGAQRTRARAAQGEEEEAVAGEEVEEAVAEEEEEWRGATAGAEVVVEVR